MNWKKKFKTFVWYEEVHNNLLKSFGLGNEDILENALETLLESAKAEMNITFKKYDLDRAETLLHVVKHFICYLHIQKLLLKEGFQGSKYLYAKIISCFLDLCIFLSHGLPSPPYLESACQELFLCSGNDVTYMWDSLLHCCLLKKVHATVCCPFLRRLLSVPVDEDVEPKQYMKFILLCRLWKVFTPEMSEKMHIKSLVLKVKMPEDFMEFLSLFPISQISSIPSKVKKEKIASYFLCKKFPKNVLMEMKQVLCDETCKSVSQVTVPSPPALSYDTCIGESLFYIDRGKDDDVIVSPGDSSAWEDTNENCADAIEEGHFSNLSDIISCASKQMHLSLLQENIPVVPVKMKSFLDAREKKEGKERKCNEENLTDNAKCTVGGCSLTTERGNCEKNYFFEMCSIGQEVVSESNKMNNITDLKDGELDCCLNSTNEVKEQQFSKQQSGILYSESNNVPEEDGQIKKRKPKSIDFVACSQSESDAESRATGCRSDRLVDIIRMEESGELFNDSHTCGMDSSSCVDGKHCVNAHLENCGKSLICEHIPPSDQNDSVCYNTSNTVDLKIEGKAGLGRNVKSCSVEDGNVLPKKLSLEAVTRCKTWLKECKGADDDDAEKSDVAVSEVLENALAKNDPFNGCKEGSEVIVVPSLAPVENKVERCIPIAIKPNIICRSTLLSNDSGPFSFTEENSTLTHGNFLHNNVSLSSSVSARDVETEERVETTTEKKALNVQVGQDYSNLISPDSSVLEKRASSPLHVLDTESADLEKNLNSASMMIGCNNSLLAESRSFEPGSETDQCRYVKCVYPGQNLPSLRSSIMDEDLKLDSLKSSLNENGSYKSSSSNSHQIAIMTPVPPVNANKCSLVFDVLTDDDGPTSLGKLCSTLIKKPVSGALGCGELQNNSRPSRKCRNGSVSSSISEESKDPAKPSRKLRNDSVSSATDEEHSTETPIRRSGTDSLSSAANEEVQITGEPIQKPCSGSDFSGRTVEKQHSIAKLRHNIHKNSVSSSENGEHIIEKASQKRRNDSDSVATDRELRIRARQNQTFCSNSALNATDGKVKIPARPRRKLCSSSMCNSTYREVRVQTRLSRKLRNNSICSATDEEHGTETPIQKCCNDSVFSTANEKVQNSDRPDPKPCSNPDSRASTGEEQSSTASAILKHFNNSILTAADGKVPVEPSQNLHNNSISNLNDATLTSPSKPLRQSLRILENKKAVKDFSESTNESNKLSKRSQSLIIVSPNSQSDLEFHSPKTSDCDDSELDDRCTPPKPAVSEAPKTIVRHGSRKRLYVDLSKSNVGDLMDSAKKMNDSTHNPAHVYGKIMLCETVAKKLIQNEVGIGIDNDCGLVANSKTMKAPEPFAASFKKSSEKKAVETSPSKNSEDKHIISSPTLRSSTKYNLRRRSSQTPWKTKKS